VFLVEASRKIHREMKLGTWKFRSLYRACSLIFRRWDVGIWTGLIWPRIETFGGSL